jgi:glycosyltransferase involved in cell wall biosynthesis
MRPSRARARLRAAAASDVYRGGAERFAGNSLSGTALSALAGDLRFVARLRGLRGLVHLPNQHLARYGLRLNEPYVVTVHDLIRYLDLLDGGGLIAAPGRRDAWYLRRDYAGVRRAAAVIAVSEATRRNVVRHLGVPRERVFAVVVHNGLDHERFRPPAQPIDPGYPYVLFVGSEHPRKNLASVLRALKLLKRTPGLRGLKLVKLGAAGRPPAPFRERTRRAIELAGLGEDDVVFCERVAGEEMPAWYAGALCVVLPSLHEGFGMPPLEAMACGCPAVISSDPALVEVAGPAALVVDAHDYRALAEAVQTLALDWPLRRRIVQRGLRHAQDFSWQQAAIETHAVYARVGAGAVPEPSLNDTRNSPPGYSERRTDRGAEQPRKYILPVYFRSAPNAKPHHQLGMKKQLTVASDTGARPPEVDGISLTRDNKPFPSALP